MLDPWSLTVLVTVADEGSFSAAAEKLSLTQPAVSRQISGLERRLGVALFRRAARGVTVTSSGAEAVGMARGALAQLDAVEAQLKSLGGDDTGTLRIAAFSSANTALVPAAIRAFGAAHPGVTLSLLQIDPLDPTGAVRNGIVDLALLTDWQLYADPAAARVHATAEPLPLTETHGVDLFPLLDEELQVALPRAHRLAGRRTVRLADLRDDTWIDGAYPDCLGPVHQLTEAMGRPPHVGYACDDWNGKKALVDAGAGIMLVPTLARSDMPPGVVLRPTTPRLSPRKLFAALPRAPFRTRPAEAMLSLLSSLLPSEGD
jgi:DNA-binding transcriptional LysR family regulator